MTGPFKTLDALEASLKAIGVAERDVRQLLTLAKPCAALVSTSASDDDIPIGSSKIGGAPDLPKDISWPTRARSATEMRATAAMIATAKGAQREDLAAKLRLAEREAPLAFMMEVDMAACWASGELDPDLPRDGHLILFYDLVFKPWNGHDEDGTARFRLIYTPGNAGPLDRRPPPDLGSPLFGREADYQTYRDRLPPARLTPLFTYMLPDGGSMPYMTYPPRGRQIPHEDWLDAYPTHLAASNRLGGWPENIQKDMAVQLAAEQQGVELPFGPEFWTAAERMQPFARSWVLLLQIGDYDNKINDFDGLFYVWIRREDLKTRDFAKARLLFQTD